MTFILKYRPAGVRPGEPGFCPNGAAGASAGIAMHGG